MDRTEIVTAMRARDPAGLAAAYDSYADRLFSYCTGMLRDRDAAGDAVHDTFVVAYERIEQLRDPDRLRSWLYAIARNECLRILRDRCRTAELDEAVAVSDETIDADGRLRDDELRRLVWAAADGLNPREREVLDLAVRHDLEMPEVAKALGVTAKHAHALLSKARQQLERAVGALIVARTGRRDCTVLDGLLTGWDGKLTVLLRKRVARHIESCRTCADRHRHDVSAQALFAATPLLLAPAALRDDVLATGTAAALADSRAEIAGRAGRFDRTGFPVPIDRSAGRAGLRSRPVAAALVIPALVLGGMAIAEQRLGGASSEQPPVVPVVTETPTPTPSVNPPAPSSPEPLPSVSPVTPAPEPTQQVPDRPAPTTAETPRTRATPSEPVTTRTATPQPTPRPTRTPLPPVIISPVEPTRTPGGTAPPPVP